MSSINGYTFYFKQDGSELITFPITPPSLKISVGSKNEVVTLITEGDINILKAPSLTDVEFTARFPMRRYPYSKTHDSFQAYFDVLKALKEGKQPFQFIVARNTPKGDSTWDTNITVALEDMVINEDADEGDDVLIDFKLKQYKPYGIKKLPAKSVGDKPTTTSTSDAPRESKPIETQSYPIKSGDTLWAIAKLFYGNGASWTKIYNANKNTIENEAKKHGKSSSSNGHWIYPNCVITIPK